MNLWWKTPPKSETFSINPSKWSYTINCLRAGAFVWLRGRLRNMYSRIICTSICRQWRLHINAQRIISTSTVESVPPSFSAAAIVIIVVVVWDAIIIMIIIFVLLLQARAPTLLLSAHEHTYIFVIICTHTICNDKFSSIVCLFLPFSSLQFLSSLSSHPCGFVCGTTTLFIRRFCLGFTA